MGIKRLLYEQKGFPVNVTYEGEGEIKTLKAECGITAAFYMGEESFKEDSIFRFPDGSGVSYRMGWNRAAVFERRESGFHVLELYDPTSGMARMDLSEEIGAIEFSQIVTQAVDTCILVYIEAGNRCILAHFMDSRLPDFVNHLSDLVAKEQINVFFCSTLVSANAQDDTWMKAVDTLQQYTGAAEKVLFERDECGNNCYFNHMEVGIGMEKGRMVYFGDIGCSTPIIRESAKPITDCSCALFAYDRAGELQDLTRIAGEVLAAEPTKP